MNWSVMLEGQYWEAVIPRKPNVVGHFHVRLERHPEKPRQFCILARDYNDAWTVIVVGDNLIGPRLVNGFKTRWQAMEYAAAIRPEINTEYKASLSL